MALSDDLLNEVKALTDELGKSITFQTVTKTGDPTDGTVTETGDTPHTVVAPVFFAEEKYIDGDTIRSGDLQTVLAAKDITFTPIKGMKVTVDSDAWETIRVDKIYAQSTIVAYHVFMRN